MPASSPFLRLVFAWAVLTSTAAAQAAPLPRLQVSANKRFLATADGKPFFYLADTAWELFHRLDRAQAVQYLDLRARQRYTAIQAVALAELEGLADPNAYGDLPLVARDPGRPATTPGAALGNATEYDYWDHVDFVIDEANKRGLYVALLPTWASWVRDEGRKVFTPDNAQTYGEFLGKRYGKKGIIWVLGGDRDMTGLEEIERRLAKGIALGATGKESHDALLMTLHPPGGRTSSKWFHDDPWLDFNMHQTGHSRAEKTRVWRRIAADYARTPIKPVVDGEPLYEDHPVEFNAKEFGYSVDAHTRERFYWATFSGACGWTYGNHAVWQMYGVGKKPINGPLMPWNAALYRPGAAQAQHGRALLESRPFFSRVPDQSLVEDPLEGADYIAATRGDGYALVYSPKGRKFTAVLGQGKISGSRLKLTWFNPRTGTTVPSGVVENTGTLELQPPNEGFGGDWVLVMDDESKGFRAPGAPGPVVP